jgi:glycine cleavage system H protein
LEAIVVKEGYYYTETHEWIKVVKDIAWIGITDYAQHELGDIVFVELPEIGTDIQAGESCLTIEAVKAVEEIKSPVSGEIIEVNEELIDAPEIINKSAFKDGWLMKVRMVDTDELDDFLTAGQYKDLIEE